MVGPTECQAREPVSEGSGEACDRETWRRRLLVAINRELLLVDGDREMGHCCN